MARFAVTFVLLAALMFDDFEVISVNQKLASVTGRLMGARLACMPRLRRRFAFFQLFRR